MNLNIILILCGVSLLIGLNRNRIIKRYLILEVNLIAIFILQPNLPIRYLGFWLPYATIFITIASWVIINLKSEQNILENLPALLMILATILFIGLGRSLGLISGIFPSQPPGINSIFITAFISVVCLLLISKTKFPLTAFWIVLILLIYIVIKTPTLLYYVSVNLRSINQQSAELANSFDIRWLGFSYIAFRIIHTIRDHQLGKLPDVGLADYINYVIFFPTLAAGPIDRLDGFLKKLENPLTGVDEKYTEGFKRLAIGMFKKFVLADSLSLIALSGTNALQIHSAGWMWVSLYAYTLQIYFDFSGYTDIAIGMGHLIGISLPENFSSPYLKSNITLFWNNWHITLTQWFRTYFFNPLTRFLRSRYKKLTVPCVILITQLSTMVLIGLWHRVTLNFIVWGLWHGFGLFLQNRWSNGLNGKLEWLVTSPILKQTANVAGILITFNFVAIGWVFFVLPSPNISWQVILKLFGVL